MWSFEIKANDVVDIHKNNIKLEADTITVVKKSNKIVLIGNVFVEKENFTLFGDKMEVFYSMDSHNKVEIKTITGNNNIVLKNQTMQATSDSFKYIVKKDTLILKDNVVLKEKDAIVYGKELLYDVVKNEFKIIGDHKKGGQRVKIVIDDLEGLQNKYGK